MTWPKDAKKHNAALATYQERLITDALIKMQTTFTGIVERTMVLGFTNKDEAMMLLVACMSSIPHLQRMLVIEGWTEEQVAEYLSDIWDRVEHDTYEYFNSDDDLDWEAPL